jgi:hypothetical protein
MDHPRAAHPAPPAATSLPGTPDLVALRPPPAALPRGSRSSRSRSSTGRPDPAKVAAASWRSRPPCTCWRAARPARASRRGVPRDSWLVCPEELQQPPGRRSPGRRPPPTDGAGPPDRPAGARRVDHGRSMPDGPQSWTWRGADAPGTADPVRGRTGRRRGARSARGYTPGCLSTPVELGVLLPLGVALVEAAAAGRAHPSGVGPGRRGDRRSRRSALAGESLYRWTADSWRRSADASCGTLARVYSEATEPA